MPMHKVQLFFEYSSAGWSETYFAEFTNPQQAINSFVQNFVPTRMTLITAGDAIQVKCVAIRAADLTDPKKHQLATTGFVGTYVAPAGIDPEMPWTGVLTRISAVNGSRRSFVLKGVPDDVVDGDWFSPVSRAKFDKAFADLRVAAAQLSLQMQTLNTTLNPLLTISSIVAAAGSLTVVTVADHNLFDDDLVVFKSVKASIPIQGRHRVDVISATSFKINGFNVGTVGFLSGRVRKVSASYSPWETWALIRKAERKVGRPYFLLRGRR